MQIWKLWKLLQLMPHVFNTRTRVEGNDEIIGYAIVISVSILYSRHFFIAFSSCLYDSWTHVWWTIA